jgi:hypothetical protein
LEKGLRKEHQKELEGDVEKEKRRSSFYYRIKDNGRRFLQIHRDLGEMIMNCMDNDYIYYVFNPCIKQKKLG